MIPKGPPRFVRDQRFAAIHCLPPCLPYTVFSTSGCFPSGRLYVRWGGTKLIRVKTRRILGGLLCRPIRGRRCGSGAVLHSVLRPMGPGYLPAVLSWR